MEELEIRQRNGSWTEDVLFARSTSIPEIIEEESNQITTVVIFVISAVLAITLLFVAAIFLDCRQQKLQKLRIKPRRKLLRLRLPISNILPRVPEEDKNTIVDNMEENADPGPSSNNAIV